MATRRNVVVDALVTQLKGIDGTGSYYNDLGNRVQRGATSRKRATTLPAVWVREESEDYDNEGSPEPALDRDLRITLETEARSNPYEKPQEAAELLADLERALMSDQTLGGVACWITLQTNRISTDETDGERAWLDLDITVRYRAQWDDPDTAVP